jgi:arylsulfatase A-like enzyme
MLFSGCSSRKEPPRPNIILITCDTTNAEALGVYGNTRIHTPVIDSLARSGCLFSNCSTHAPITLPSHSCILTGLLPTQHGVRNNSTYKLASSIETLPELLKNQGYDTGAFISSFILNHQYGLNQGFDVYSDHIIHYKKDREKKAIITRRAGTTIELAVDWIKDRKKPFFSWIHLYDPHWPYDPPAPFDIAYTDDPYLGEIAYMDLQIGLLIKHLKEMGQWDRTLIILTGDHGESRGRHGENSHGFFCYNATTHVPLILSKPVWGTTSSARIDYPVESIDIVPTICDLLQIEKPTELKGINLFRDEPRTIYSEAMIPFEDNYCSPVIRLKNNDYSVYHSSQWELYDLQEDPEEHHNLFNKRGTRGDRLVQHLQDIKLNIGSNNSEEVQLDQETIDLLKSLGYVHDGGTFIPDNQDVYHRKSPLNSIDIFKAIQSGKIFEDNYPFKYLHILTELKNKHPDHPLVLREYGRMNVLAGNRDLAIDNLRAAAQLVPEDPRLHSMVGLAYYHFKEYEESLDEFRIALELSPEHLISRYNASVVLIELGRYEPARENLEKVLEGNPNDIFTLNNLALIAWDKDGNKEKALKYLNKANQINPTHPLILRNISRIK